MKRSTKYLLRLLIVAVALGLLFGSDLLFPQDLDAALPSSQEETYSDAASLPEETAEAAESASEGSTDAALPDETSTAATDSEATIDEDGSYDQKDDVALYIHTYGHLPSNYITKSEAEAAGWSGGSVEKYCPGKCIGGSRFGNYEGQLPDADDRVWTECDINTLGASSRGAERIVYSNDGLIYYTGDHYESFELLYGTP